ncbi:MAG TPA: glycoside hydrolase family 18 protein [Polyangia bacterium]
MTQARTAYNAGSGVTSLAASIATAPGSLLVAFVREGSNTTDSFTVTDSAGQAWTQAGSYGSFNSSNRSGLFYVANSAAVTSVTVRFTTAAGVTRPGLIVYEITGAASAVPLEAGPVTTVASVARTSITSGALTTLGTSDILLFAVDVSVDQAGTNNGFVPGTGYAFPGTGAGTTPRQALMYQVVTAAQTNVTTAATWSAAGSATAWFLAFRAVCTPTTCAAQGKNCGTIADGCGGTLPCGTCTLANQTCGGGGTANVCGCTPTTCAAQGKNCGTIADGCGGTLPCGSCAAGQSCTANVCTGAMALSVTQARTAYNAGSGVTSLTASIATTPGSLLVAFVREGSNTTDGFSLTDSAAQTWIQAGSYGSFSGSNRSGLFYVASSAAVTSVTARFTTAGGVTRPGLVVYEIAGAASAVPLDAGPVTSVASAAQTSLTSAALTTTGTTDIFLFAVDVSVDQTGTNNGFVPGTGYLFPAAGAATTPRQAVAYKVVSAAQTSETTAATWSAAGSATSWLVAFRTSCTPTTCAAQGKNCGTIADGCGGTLPCGSCASGQSCTANVCTGATTIPAGTVSGHWTLGGSPYLITGDIKIPNGSTLTIDPGVRVEFQGPYKMQCYGGLHAVGTSTQRIQFTTTAADVAKGAWAWTGWRGLRISGSHTYQTRDGLHDFGAGLFNIQWTEIAYVDKAQGGLYTNYDPHEEWNGNFYASDIMPGDLIFDNNWVHHAKASTSTGGGQLFWVSHLGGGYVPNTVPDYYFYNNVFEDSQWGGAYFAHNARADGSLVVAHLVGGAFRRTQRQPQGSSSVCSVFATSASLDGVEITDCGDRVAAPWFAVVTTPGTITYTPPAAATVAVTVAPASASLLTGATQQFSATVTGSTNPAVTWSVVEAGGGTITSGGLYTAPATAGSYTVKALASADGVTAATATVTVTGGASSGLWVGGYWADWTVGSGSSAVHYPYTAIDWSALTHLFVANANVSATGTLTYNGGSLNSTMARAITTAAHANGRKAILMIGGVGSNTAYNSAVLGNLSAFVATILAMAQGDGFDGVDIDWETLQVAERPQFAALAVALRAAWPGMILTAALPNNQGVDSWWGSVSTSFDQMNVMSYDNVGNWGGWQTWFQAALADETTSGAYQRPWSIGRMLNNLAASGVPKTKIGMGIPFYGLNYPATMISTGCYGPRQDLVSTAVATQAGDGKWTYKYILDNYASKAYDGPNPDPGTGRTMPDGVHTGAIFDPASGNSYVTGGAAGWTGVSGTATSIGFLNFESPQSIAAKGAWCRTAGNPCSGTIVWLINEGVSSVTTDPVTGITTYTNPLLAAVKAAFLQ